MWTEWIDFNLLLSSLAETLGMVFFSGFLAALLGIPLGVLLFITRPGQFLSTPWLYRSASLIVNLFRALPFIILLVAIIPLTRFLVGTSIGTLAAVVPLTVGAIPFVGRLTENALLALPTGLTETGLALGAAPYQIIVYFLLPESLPALIQGITLTLVTLVGYSAMAGAVGGGGLGDLAIRYGYERFDIQMMCATVILLIGLVQGLQYSGDRLSRYFMGG